ncbi:hypothetical protein Q604_UNBC17365G0001, partial [human gut metagenome]
DFSFVCPTELEDLQEQYADLKEQVLTAEEEASDSMPSGNDWQVMTEEEYQQSKQEQKEKNSSFALPAPY